MKVQPPCQTSSVGGCGCVYVCVREGWGGRGRERQRKRGKKGGEEETEYIDYVQHTAVKLYKQQSRHRKERTGLHSKIRGIFKVSDGKH